MMKKVQSTTYFITIISFLLNPIAWILDWIFKKDLMKYIIENNIDISQLHSIDKLIVEIPLTTIATAFVTIATAYVAGQKTKAVTTNLGLPKGQGISEDSSDK